MTNTARDVTTVDRAHIRERERADSQMKIL
jgi:hypothetical protein